MFPNNDALEVKMVKNSQEDDPDMNVQTDDGANDNDHPSVTMKNMA